MNDVNVKKSVFKNYLFLFFCLMGFEDFHSSLPCIGEGNGNPLQCSCLENPRDGGNPSGLLSMGLHRVGHD